MRLCTRWPLFLVGFVFLVVLLFTLPGCETVGGAVDAIPLSADQLDAASDTSEQVGAWFPSPWNWVINGLAVGLAGLADIKRRRANNEKQTVYDGAVQIVGSVKTWLDRRPDDERNDVKDVLAANQDANAKALVSQAKAEIKKAADVAG